MEWIQEIRDGIEAGWTPKFVVYGACYIKTKGQSKRRVQQDGGYSLAG